MNFHRPFDLSPHGNSMGEVCDVGGYTFYKVKVIMPTPGELYYLGVVLLHKQYMINSEDEELNSDIVFIPMISRPDTPDWADTPISRKGFMPFQKWDDFTYVYEQFLVNRLSDRGFVAAPPGTLRAIRQICGPTVAEWTAQPYSASNPNEYHPLGALWKIMQEDEGGAPVQGYRARPVSEGVAILSGANTRTTELALIWSFKNDAYEHLYDSRMHITQVHGAAGVPGSGGASENLIITDFNRYEAFIQAPYPDSNYISKLRYIRLYKDGDYGTLTDDNARSQPDEDNGTFVDFANGGYREPPSSGNGPGQIVIDACSIAIANRLSEPTSGTIQTECIDLRLAFGRDLDNPNPYRQGLLEMFSEQGLYQYGTPLRHLAMYEKNVNYFATPLLILGDDQGPNGAAAGMVKRWEQRNRMVRKFYIFWAEKEEDTFKIQDEPMDITNRDWSDAMNHFSVEAVDKFHKDRRFVVKRFINDGRLPAYEMVFERWTMIDSMDEPRANEYVCASSLDNGVHVFDIYTRSDYDSNIGTTASTQTALPVYSVSAAQLATLGVYNNSTGVYTLSLRLMENGSQGPELSYRFRKTIESTSFNGNQNPKLMGYNWNGTNITLNNVALTLEQCFGTHLYQRVNGRIMYSESVDLLDPNYAFRSMFYIHDLDPTMNIHFGLDNTADDNTVTDTAIASEGVQGTWHYRCSLNQNSNYLDCYLVRDSVHIADPNFLKAKQRAYCLAAICETHDPNMNYWTYTNRVQF
jgi:hypothetical protein